MSDRPTRGKPSSVPSSRFTRLAGFGSLTAGIAGRGIIEGAKRLSRGEVPTTRDLLLTPANMLQIANELARMRGAALKLGQLLSMDAGDMLPRELANMLTRLRADADFMPQPQLAGVLQEQWGVDWQTHFRSFDLRPIAAASIGQVHKAVTNDGKNLAIKVQYPGVAKSIDSDIDNVMSLFRLSGLAPPMEKLEPLIDEAKRQLHEEADYAREAENIRLYGASLSGLEGFRLPEVQHDLSTDKILAMSFVAGDPIEQVERMDDEARNRIFEKLATLAFKEVFEFSFVQTDPNFANYVYDRATDTIGLLDFGAARALSTDTVRRYRKFLAAGIGGRRKEFREAAIELQLYSETTAPQHRNMVDRISAMVFAEIKQNRLFDFADEDLLQKLHASGMELAFDRTFNEVPHPDILYLQRKAAGFFLLGRRLGASIPMQEMMTAYLGEPNLSSTVKDAV